MYEHLYASVSKKEDGKTWITNFHFKSFVQYSSILETVVTTVAILISSLGSQGAS